jgi:hypothetical protein
MLRLEGREAVEPETNRLGLAVAVLVRVNVLGGAEAVEGGAREAVHGGVFQG